MKPAPKPRAPHPEARLFRPLPRAVQGWSEDDQERFYEMAGKQLSDGVEPSLADQRAMLELAKERRARAAA